MIGLGLHRRATGAGFVSDVNGVATAAKLAAMMSGGDFDESFFVTYSVSGPVDVSFAGTYLFLSADTPDGLLEFGYTWGGYKSNAAGSFFLRVRDTNVVAVGNTNGNTFWNDAFHPGDVFYIRVWYRPSIGQYGIAMFRNGEWRQVVRGATTGSALAAPTAAWIKSLHGTSLQLQATHDTWTSHAIGDVFTDPSVLVGFEGDSIMASVVVVPTTPGSMISPSHSAARTGLMYSNARSSDTVTGQTADLANWSCVKSAMRLIACESGVNEIIGATTAAQALAHKVSQLTAIQSTFPNLTDILLIWIPPCKGDFDIASGAPDYQKVLDYNAGLSALVGSHGVTGVVTSHYNAMCTSVQNYLDSAIAYDTIHPNWLGRSSIFGPAILAAIQAKGYLLGV